MVRCPCQKEELVITKFSNPHCDTCDCNTENVTVRRNIMLPGRLPEIKEEIIRPAGFDWDSVTRSMATYCRNCSHPKSGTCSDHCTHNCGNSSELSRETHRTLRDWFRQFDFNENGLLDFHELRQLLEFSGAFLRNSQIKRLLNTYGFHMDGQLSFPEFVRMWHSAALHEDDFVRSTGCYDVVDVARQNHFYPHIGRVHDHDEEPFHRTPIFTYQPLNPFDEEPCDCGIDPNNKVFIGSNRLKASNDAYQERIPMFSTNRDTTYLKRR